MKFEPNKIAAANFLTLLDSEANSFTFQAFDDNKDRKDSSLAITLNGTLEEHFDTLVRFNKRGAGIFVTVNRTDGNGRRKENIMGTRAVWVEADFSEIPPLPLEPHIVVESSPGKYHKYILVNDAPLSEFEDVQQRLVDAYGSDPNAKDRSRVLRLPGFYHMKHSLAPHLVKVVQTSGTLPMQWETVKELLGVQPTKPIQRTIDPNAKPLEDPAKIASALAILDPDKNYDTWLKVGMALHSTNANIEALEMWEEWSKRGTLFRQDECEKKWQSFTMGGEITLGTLFHLAKEAGWDNQISTTKEVLPWIEHHQKQALEEFNKYHGVAMINGAAVIVYRERDCATGYMTTRFSRLIDIRTKHQADKIPFVKCGKEEVEYKQLVDVWLNSKSRHTYNQVVFDPVPDLIAGEDKLPNTKALNLYQGLAITPTEGDVDPILQHIYHIWCNDDKKAYDYVMCWLARMMQIPNERGHTALVLRSGEGTGKNIIVDILIDAFGEHASVAVKTEELSGHFNDHLAHSVLVFANEAIWGGDKAREGAIKSLITDEWLTTEKKYMPKYRMKNCVHLILASNNEWVVPVGIGDRRFIILDVNESRKNDVDYFNLLSKHIAEEGAAAFIHCLLHWNIDNFNPRVLPKIKQQETKLSAKKKGATSTEQFWINCLEEGEIMSSTDPYAIDLATDDWKECSLEIPTQQLYDAYIKWAKMLSKRIDTQNSFGRTLKKLTDVSYKNPAINSKRTRVYCIPPLTTCRKQLEIVLEQPIEWEQL